MEASSATPLPLNPEPSIFLPRGRIGVRSMVVRSGACYLLLFISGLLVRELSIEAGRDMLLILVYLLMAFMFITGIKRAHDMDYSGWAVIILSGLPILLLLPGTKGSNRFGPLPTRWF